MVNRCDLETEQSSFAGMKFTRHRMKCVYGKRKLEGLYFMMRLKL